MPLLKKQRRVKNPKQPGYAVFKRRRRIGLFVVILLMALIVGGLVYLFLGNREEASNAPPEQASTPATEQAPEETSAEEEPTQEQTEEAPPAPSDPTLFLTVPRLGMYGHVVRNDRSEAALDLGAIKLPDTNFPWEKGDINTYIACHRLGWPGNESFHECLNLPSMQKGDDVILTDANGRDYKYRVSEFLQVLPTETWATQPESGRKMVTLQTCIETYNDFVTLGPNWSVRFLVRADRVA